MQTAPFLRLVFLASVAVSWAYFSLAQTPPAAGWQWYKGNLHTHTINSDGDSAPDVVARWYKEHRYHFLALTDHNYLTDPQGLNPLFAARDRFLLLAGEEVTSKFGEKAVHVNAFGIKKTIGPVFGPGLVSTIQGNVDAIREGNGMPSLNHPNFRWSITPDEFKRVTGLKLFEVYNGHPTVHNEGGGGYPSLDEMWDAVLTAGRRVYGIAVDDAHYFKQFGPGRSNPGRGWVVVKAPNLSEEAILDALDRGEFYASTGVELGQMERLRDGIRLKIRQERDFRYTTEFLGAGGKVLERTHGLEAEYRLRPGERYVRARVTDSAARRAWVQPVFAD